CCVMENIGRTSVSPSQPGQCFSCSSMKRRVLSMASSLDFNSNTAYPPNTSLASVNGPSVTVIFPPAKRTREPAAVGPSPPVSIISPDFIASSASFPMASISSLGGGPEFSGALTIIKNRIVILLLLCYVPVCYWISGSTIASSESYGNRHAGQSFSYEPPR